MARQQWRIDAEGHDERDGTGGDDNVPEDVQPQRSRSRSPQLGERLIDECNDDDDDDEDDDDDDDVDLSIYDTCSTRCEVCSTDPCCCTDIPCEAPSATTTKDSWSEARSAAEAARVAAEAARAAAPDSWRRGDTAAGAERAEIERCKAVLSGQVPLPTRRGFESSQAAAARDSLAVSRAEELRRLAQRRVARETMADAQLHNERTAAAAAGLRGDARRREAGSESAAVAAAASAAAEAEQKRAAARAASAAAVLLEARERYRLGWARLQPWDSSVGIGPARPSGKVTLP